MCKRKVCVRGEKIQIRRSSSSDASASDLDDTTPLLSASNDQYHGTFPQNIANTSNAPATSAGLSDDVGE